MVSIMPDVPYLWDILHSYFNDLLSVNGSKDTKLDILCAKNRLLCEGIGFLTKTLPKLGKSLDTALKTGVFVCPTNFRKHKNSALPNFTQGLLKRVFSVDGSLLPLPDYSAITEMRQLYYMFYKSVVDFTPDDLRCAEEKFKENDRSLGDLSFSSITPDASLVLQHAIEYLGNLFRDFDPHDITPSHGPGIVASGEKPHEKRIFSTQYKGIHDEYPYYRFFYTSPTHLLDTVPSYWSRSRKAWGLNRVLFVPKDSRGPRTIACEPLEYQFVQQGLRKSLYTHVEHHPLTRGRVNFSDQSINGKLAYLSSTSRLDLCTIDLKDASDRVSNGLVKRLFSQTPLAKPLQALRTPVSVLPSGEEVTLHKYAAMGSALCFPVEALVFDALLHGIYVFYPHLKKEVYVYGDDIIAHCEVLPMITSIFHEFGLVVNQEKTCATGLFRESCGSEFYSGHDVTYVKLRSTEIRSAEDIASTIAFSNLMFDRGYYLTASSAAETVQRHLGYSLPLGNKNSPYLCLTSRFHVSQPQGRTRWNKSYQYMEHRVPVITGITYEAKPRNTDEVWGEYFRKMTQGWSLLYTSEWYAQRAAKITKKYVLVGS